MTLVPPNGTWLINCEWRLFLSPECPYVDDIIKTYQVCLYLYIFFTVVLFAILVIRLGYLKNSLFRGSKNVWWLKVNPTEFLFFAAFVNDLSRIIQVVSLLYFTNSTPLFLRNFFYTMGHSVGAFSITYFWLSIVKALPHDRIFSGAKVLHHLTAWNTFVGFIIGGIYLSTVWIEAISAQFTLTNQHLADQILTVSYVLWFICSITVSLSILYFGRRILTILKEAIEFHKTRDSKNKGSIRELRVCYNEINAAVNMIPGVLGVPGCGLLVMGIARYYIWSSTGASILLLLSFSYSSGVQTTIFAIFVTSRDLYLRFSKSKEDTTEESESHLNTLSEKTDHTALGSQITPSERRVSVLAELEIKDQNTILSDFLATKEPGV